MFGNVFHDSTTHLTKLGIRKGIFLLVSIHFLLADIGNLGVIKGQVDDGVQGQASINKQ